jgi:phosphohistidine swiveling domain-containing protein
MFAGGPNNVAHRFYNLLMDEHFLCFLLQVQNLFHAQHLLNMLQIVGNAEVVIVNFQLGYYIHITKNYFNIKTVELRRRHIPRVLLSDGTEPETLIRTEAPDGALVGSPASAGVVRGRARVVLDPAGAYLEPGEILVAPSTDPGWTPLFLTAAGLVMEMGGSMSHGAVVAREYGLPAVVGVPDATSRISTGQWVTVDGASGTVVLA